MPREHQYFVYILASRSRTLYIGVTNNLILRTLQHRLGHADSFTAKYRIDRLVYFERFSYIDKAIAREKFLKHMTRKEKLALIESTNPTWEDLAADLPDALTFVEETTDPPPSAKDDKVRSGREDDKVRSGGKDGEGTGC